MKAHRPRTPVCRARTAFASALQKKKTKTLFKPYSQTDTRQSVALQKTHIRRRGRKSDPYCYNTHVQKMCNFTATANVERERCKFSKTEQTKHEVRGIVNHDQSTHTAPTIIIIIIVSFLSIVAYYHL